MIKHVWLEVNGLHEWNITAERRTIPRRRRRKKKNCVQPKARSERAKSRIKKMKKKKWHKHIIFHIYCSLMYMRMRIQTPLAYSLHLFHFNWVSVRHFLAKNSLNPWCPLCFCITRSTAGIVHTYSCVSPLFQII